jgi:uncharacterized membrane protein YphA (DoxX/SURF4 family)
MISLVRLTGRLLLAWVFMRNGLDVLRNPQPRANTAAWLLDEVRARAPLVPVDNVTLVRTNAVAQVAAASLLALGQQTRLAALILAGSLVPTTLGGHPFWRHDDPARRAQQQIHFDKNVAILGGLLAAAALESPRRRRAR